VPRLINAIFPAISVALSSAVANSPSKHANKGSATTTLPTIGPVSLNGLVIAPSDATKTSSGSRDEIFIPCVIAVPS